MAEFKGLEHLERLDVMIDEALARLSKGVTVAEVEILQKISDLVARLDRTGSGVIPLADLGNVKKLNEIRAGIKLAVRESFYSEAVSTFLQDLAGVASPINLYFSAMVGEYGSGPVFTGLQQVYTRATADLLLGSGLEEAFERPIMNIIRDHSVRGKSTKEIRKSLVDYVLKEDYLGDAKTLNQYAGQIADDSINQFSRQMIEAQSADLDLKHYFYKGTIIRTSRDFCDRNTGRYFTEEQVLEWGERARLAELAGRRAWSGVYRGTNEGNIKIKLGGYKCRHRLAPITEELYNLKTANGTKNVFIPGEALQARKIDPPAKEKKKKAEDKAKKAAERDKKKADRIATKEKLAKAAGAADPRLKFKPKSLDGYAAETDPDFWALFPSEGGPVTFTEKGGSYHNSGKVVIDRGERWQNSPYYREKIVYHEYGHNLHNLRGTVSHTKINAEYNSHFKGAQKLTKPARAAELEYDLYHFDQVMRGRIPANITPDKLSRFQALDTRLTELGFNHADKMEMNGATADVLGSLTRGRHGWGHKKVYYKTNNGGEKEYFAHGMENRFGGNPVFAELWPDMFDHMGKYFNNMKPGIPGVGVEPGKIDIF